MEAFCVQKTWYFSISYNNKYTTVFTNLRAKASPQRFGILLSISILFTSTMTILLFLQSNLIMKHGMVNVPFPYTWSTKIFQRLVSEPHAVFASPTSPLTCHLAANVISNDGALTFRYGDGALDDYPFHYALCVRTWFVALQGSLGSRSLLWRSVTCLPKEVLLNYIHAYTQRY